MASYRIATYAAKGGDARACLLIEDRILDLESALKAYARASGRSLTFSGTTTHAVFQNWGKARPMLSAIARGSGGRAQPLGKTRLLAPLPDTGLIYCAGANYYDHAREMGTEVQKAKVKPFFFIKAGGSAIIGPGATVRLPKWSKQVDWEARDRGRHRPRRTQRKKSRCDEICRRLYDLQRSIGA